MLTWVLLFFAVAVLSQFVGRVAPRLLGAGVGVPRGPTGFEIALGIGTTLAAASLMLAVSFALGELLGPFTSFGLVLAVLFGAVIACGQRGRARIWALLFVSNFRRLDGRWYLVTDAKSRRLREIGAASLLVWFLFGGAIGLVILGFLVLLGAQAFQVAPVSADSLLPWLSNAGVLVLCACASLFTPGGRQQPVSVGLSQEPR
jgi:hypothetical protein